MIEQSGQATTEHKENMATASDIQRLERRKKELADAIVYTNEIDKRLTEYCRSLEKAYTEGTITHTVYRSKKQDVLKGRTIDQWNNYYEQCRASYRDQYSQLTEQIANETKRQRLRPIYLGLFGIVALLGVALFAHMAIISESDQPITSYSVNLPEAAILPVNESIEIINSTENRTEITQQNGAVLGRPVLWTKRITTSRVQPNITIDLPASAVNLSVRKIINGEAYEIAIENISVNQSGVIRDIRETALAERVVPLSFFGNIIQGTYDLALDITGLVVADEPSEQNITLVIEEPLQEILVEYWTEAPVATESLTQYGKTITISSTTHYENVISYTSIPEAESIDIRLYWLMNGTRQEFPFTANDTNGNLLIDYIEWVTPHLSNETFELELTILNVQSYPTVGGNWTVVFNTTGIANLTVRASNGTTWSNSSETEDLKFLDIVCNDTVQNTEWLDNAAFIENYTCSGLGQETSKVLTSGPHTMQFTFGNITKYAYNDATNAPNQTAPIINSSSGRNVTIDNITIFNQSTIDGDGDPVKNIYQWYINETPFEVLNTPFEGGSNATFTRDYSSFGNNGNVSGARWINTSGFDRTGAYKFNGTNTHIRISSKFPEITGGRFSAFMWIQKNDTTTTKTMLSQQDGTGVGRTWLNTETVQCAAQLTTFLGFGVSLCSTTTLNVNQWYHIGLVYNGTALLLYVNGVLENTSVRTVDENATGDFIIGQNKVLAQTFNGSLDEIRIYNKSLTTEQVQLIYRNSTHVIHSSMTEIYENWTGQITPNDGFVDGEAKNATIQIIPGVAGIKFDDANISFGGGFYNASCTTGFAVINSNTSRSCWINTSEYPTTIDQHRITNSGDIALNVTVRAENLNDAEQLFCGFSQGCSGSASAQIRVKSLNNEANSCGAANLTTDFETLLTHNTNSTVGICNSLDFTDTSDSIDVQVELQVPHDTTFGTKTLTLVYEAIAL